MSTEYNNTISKTSANPGSVLVSKGPASIADRQPSLGSHTNLETIAVVEAISDELSYQVVYDNRHRRRHSDCCFRYQLLQTDV